jgi:hypothetical protein
MKHIKLLGEDIIEGIIGLLFVGAGFAFATSMIILAALA